ncbi:MAG: hypothetical protein KIS76_17450 [Pyrinomonadaceae bacterium]|nr:hypothetical protein [Pyrinomonadaceae bacterium]
MRKQSLFNLTAEVRKIIGDLPVIVGSQAVFAVTDYPPEIARLSVECDFLLLGESFKFRDTISEDLGIFSEYQVKIGVHADGLGRATVVLPEDWEKRLVELRNDENETIAFCAEIHDVAVSKIIAGREKDFDFIKALFRSGYLCADVLIERLNSINRSPSSAAVKPRIIKLIEEFENENDLKDVLARFRNFARNL